MLDDAMVNFGEDIIRRCQLYILSILYLKVHAFIVMSSLFIEECSQRETTLFGEERNRREITLVESYGKIISGIQKWYHMDVEVSRTLHALENNL